MNSHQYLTKIGRFSTLIAIASFAIGTLLLLLFSLFRKADNLVIVGYFYVLIAIVLNLLVFLFLLYHLIVNPFHRKYFAGKILIMLANIPIAGLYFFLVITNFLKNF